jgi:hypothetical protein
MYWDKIVLMIGPFGDWIKFSYDDPIFLSSEIDGVRITSNDKCELLQKVPGKAKIVWGKRKSTQRSCFIIAATEDIFKIGSTSPAAMLFDALDHYEVSASTSKGQASSYYSFIETKPQGR